MEVGINDGEVKRGTGDVERSCYCIHAPIHKALPHVKVVFHTHMPFALIGAHKQRVWHGQTECLCSLEIYHQLELGRLLHWQIGGPLASQYSIDIPRRTSKLIDVIRAIGNQAALVGEEPSRIHRRQVVASRQLEDQIAME
jgi:hypothetical protein